MPLALGYIAPHVPWAWLLIIAPQIQAQSFPRSKAGRVRHSDELYALGVNLMRRADAELEAQGSASKEAALAYRDGLLIALLADFYTNDYNFGTILVSDFSTQVLAYTVKLGSGLSATLSLEDAIERRQLTSPNGTGFPGQTFDPAGVRMPDIVGQVLLERSWGKAQGSAVIRQIRSNNLVPGLNAAPLTDTDYGFAVQAGVQLKLPAIAEGDQFWLQGGYSRGALSYLGFGNTDIGNISLNQTDAYVGPFGQAELAKGWAATALFLHYWTPQIRQAVFGSYGVIDYPANSAFTVAGGMLGFVDATDWRVGTNLSWLPTSGFYIGIEGLYRAVDPRGRVYLNNDPTTGRLIGATQALEARLRLQRDF